MDFSKHTQGTTSVKVHHAPGGKSNFSLAWETGPTSSDVTGKPNSKTSQQSAQQAQGSQNSYEPQPLKVQNQHLSQGFKIGDQGHYPLKGQNQVQQTSKIGQQTSQGKGQQQEQQQQSAAGGQTAAGKTSVKVHNPPGGKSNFTLG
ncbi:unnamed protein product [Sphagnum balticum]